MNTTVEAAQGYHDNLHCTVPSHKNEVKSEVSYIRCLAYCAFSNPAPFPSAKTDWLNKIEALGGSEFFFLGGSGGLSCYSVLYGNHS